MNICLFTSEEIKKQIPAHDERTDHILKVLHKREGDTFDAGIIGGKAGTAQITHIGAKGAPDEGQIAFTFMEESAGKPLYPLILVIGFPRPIQLRRLLRDAAGLGVCEVHLTGTELGEKSYMKSTLVEKGAAYQMLLDGTAQAAGTHVPELFLHETLHDCLACLAHNADQNALRIALDNENPPVSLHNFLESHNKADTFHNGACAEHASARTVIAAIGSERGWSDKERGVLESAEFTRCGMGVRILRTETAATAAASLILDSLGYLS